MDIRKLTVEPLMQDKPAGVSLSEVVRLARAYEWVRWDALMHHHYLGFKRFAGHGLRYLRGVARSLVAARPAGNRCFQVFSTRPLDR